MKIAAANWIVAAVTILFFTFRVSVRGSFSHIQVYDLCTLNVKNCQDIGNIESKMNSDFRDTYFAPGEV